MSLLAAVFSLTMLAQALRTAVPYAFAALGGVLSERSGVVNIALEGMLLASALASVGVNHATGSPVLGLLGAVGAGATVAFAHAFIVVRGRVDAIVSGLALNLIAAGGTRFLLRALYDSSANSPAVHGFATFGEGSSGALLLARTVADPLTILAVLGAAGTAFVLFRTRFGLRARSAGEDPDAAASVGIDVASVRTRAVVLGGALCGLGGAALGYDQHQFQSGMSGGRGFIALAAVIVSGWRPGRAILACLAFAAFDALQIVLEDHAQMPREIVEMLPYAATLAALVVIGRRRAGIESGGAGGPPRGLGRHPER